jgi:hypothetical protein
LRYSQEQKQALIDAYEDPKSGALFAFTAVAWVP